MKYVSAKTLKFLKDIKKNNNRDWFTEHKTRYTETREEFISFVQHIINQISKFDPPIEQVSAKKAVFRIYRDTRFSKDKTPYKINIGAHLNAFANKVHDRAGYYIHIEPGNCFLAGGAYLPPGTWIKAIRKEIDYDAKSLRKIIASASFKKYFGEIQGEQLKCNPRDYPKDHPDIDLLKYKSFLAVHPLTDAQVKDENFDKHCIKVFKALKPFDDYLNRALD